MGKNSFIFIALLTGLVGCGRPDRAETVMPSGKPSCGAEAITSSYIVRFKNGDTKIVHEKDREKFKEEYVRPQLDQIEYIEYDQKISVNSEISPFTKVTGMVDNWGLRRIQAEGAWQNGFYGQNVTVAVIDSGVDINHPLLAGRILRNTKEVINGIDDDGNGYVDDVAGYDFLNRRPDVTDEIFHGTHVAGIIAAEHSQTSVSNSQAQGVAPLTKILPLKFIGNLGGSLSAALEAIEYARQARVDIINASWGGPTCAKALDDKIRDITNEGIIFVVASGNSGQNLDWYPEFPAAFSHPLQVTVGSSGTLDGMSSFSNYSSSLVHLFAPGFDITSTLPGGQIGKQSGTSMATPFVAGALAVLKSAQPTASPQALIHALLNSVDENPTYINRTHGRLNVTSALQLISQ